MKQLENWVRLEGVRDNFSSWEKNIQAFPTIKFFNFKFTTQNYIYGSLLSKNRHITQMQNMLLLNSKGLNTVWEGIISLAKRLIKIGKFSTINTIKCT